MRKPTLWVLCLVALYVPATSAQQNLFNIPSGDITPTSEVFIQQQTNIYDSHNLETKLHTVYGLHQRVDVGLNLLNMAWDTRSTSGDPLQENYRNLRLPQAPLLMASAQYAQPLPHHLQLNVGGQMGYNVLAPPDERHMAYKSFAMLMYKTESLRLLAGGYVANTPFAGQYYGHGLLLGTEWHCWQWGGLMADMVGGPNAIGATVVGGYANLGPYVQLCGGVLLKDTGDTVLDGFVLEVNVFTWDWQHH